MYKNSNNSNTLNRNFNDSWGFDGIGFISAEKLQKKEYDYTNYLNRLYDGYFLPLHILDDGDKKIAVKITENSVINLPFNIFVENVTKKYGKLSTIHITVQHLNDNTLPTLKNWTQYAVQFCKHCYVNDLYLKGANNKVAVIGSPVKHYPAGVNTKIISLKNLRTRDMMNAINWSLNNEKEIKLFKYFTTKGEYYKLHKNLYKQLKQFEQGASYLDESSAIITYTKEKSVDDLLPKYELINKIYNLSTQYTLPQTYFRTNYKWTNHPFDVNKNYQDEYTTVTNSPVPSSRYKYHSYVSKNAFKPMNAMYTVNDEIKAVLSETSNYCLVTEKETQTYTVYNQNNPTVKQEVTKEISYRVVKSKLEILEEETGTSIEYTSFEDTYTDEYEENMSAYNEEYIDSIYSEAQAEEEAEYANFWDDEE